MRMGEKSASRTKGLKDPSNGGLSLKKVDWPYERLRLFPQLLLRLTEHLIANSIADIAPTCLVHVVPWSATTSPVMYSQDMLTEELISTTRSLDSQYIHLHQRATFDRLHPNCPKTSVKPYVVTRQHVYDTVYDASRSIDTLIGPRSLH